jgi:hypothetical protein
MAIVLAALSLLGLGIFGPGIANGLVSGGPAARRGRRGRHRPCRRWRGARRRRRRRLAAKGGAAPVRRRAAVRGGAPLAGGSSAAYSSARSAVRRSRRRLRSWRRRPRRRRRSHVTAETRARARRVKRQSLGFSDGGRPASRDRRLLDHGHRRRRRTAAAPPLPQPSDGPPAWAKRMKRSQALMSHGVTAPPTPSAPATATAPAPPSISPKVTAHEPLQATRRPLRQDAGTRDALSARRAGLGRAHRLGPRAGEELALMAFGSLFLSAGFAARWSGSRRAAPSCPGWCRSTARPGAAPSPGVADYRPTDPQIAWHLARFIEQVRSIPPIRSSCGRTGCAPTSGRPIAAPPRSTTMPAPTTPSPRSASSRSPSRSRASSAPRRIPSASPGPNAATRTASSPAPSAGPPSSPSSIQPPRDADRLRANPLGIYVNAINWSREMGQ